MIIIKVTKMNESFKGFAALWAFTQKPVVACSTVEVYCM